MVNIEKLENLPFRENRWQRINSICGNMYDIDRFDHPWKPDEQYHKMKYWILRNNIGKSFDLAFSYFCKKVPSRLHYIFLEEFDEIPDFYGWYLDENKNIQYKSFIHKTWNNKSIKKIDRNYYYKQFYERKTKEKQNKKRLKNE